MKKTIVALAIAVVFASGSAFAQDKKYSEVTPEQSQAQVKAVPTDKPQVAPSINVEELAKQKLTEWQKKKRECFIAAGLTENVHFRQNPDNPTNFQVKESVYLNAGFNVPAIRKCVDLKS